MSDPENNKMSKADAKKRQNYLSNQHSSLTTFQIAVLSRYCTITVPFPNKQPHRTLLFPKVRTLQFPNEDSIDIYSVIKQRINARRKLALQERAREQARAKMNGIDKNKEKGPKRVNERMNFERRYELSHFLEDFLNQMTDFTIVGAKEEHGGISGNYYIEIGEERYDSKGIQRISKVILEKLYGGRGKNEINRKIEMGELEDLLSIK